MVSPRTMINVTQRSIILTYFRSKIPTQTGKPAVDDEFHRAILLRIYFEKHGNVVIKREHLLRQVVAPSVGGNLFEKITGEDLLLALPSEALRKMTVHTLCSLIRIARKEGVFGYLQAKIDRLLGQDKNGSEKSSLDKILEHSPNINKKCDVSRIVFFARLSVFHRMETEYMSGDSTRFIVFDAATAKTVRSSLDSVSQACGEDAKERETNKRRREDTE